LQYDIWRKIYDPNTETYADPNLNPIRFLTLSREIPI